MPSHENENLVNTIAPAHDKPNSMLTVFFDSTQQRTCMRDYFSRYAPKAGTGMHIAERSLVRAMIAGHQVTMAL
jgi:hypothetical protein